MIALAGIWCAIYLACLLICGYGAVAWFDRGRSRLEIIGLSACLGPPLVGWWLIAWSMLGHLPSRAAILSLTFVAMVSIACQNRLQRRLRVSPAPTAKTSPWGWAMLAATIYGGCFIFVDALVYPTTDWDAVQTWQLKARILAREALMPRPEYFTDVNLSYSHLRYPIMVPIISAGAIAMVGPQNDWLGKAPYFLMYCAMSAMMFGWLAKRRGDYIAFVATTLLVTLPLLLAYGGAGTAEMALVSLDAGCLIVLLSWCESRTAGDLILAAIFSAALAWTKNEGLVLAVIHGVIVLVVSLAPPRRYLFATALFGLVVILFYMAWPLYTRGLPRTDEDYLGHLTASRFVHHLDRAPVIWSRMAREMIDPLHWSIFWFVLVLVQVLAIKRLFRPCVLVSWGQALLQIVAVTVAYIIVSNWNLDELLTTSIDRMVLHLTPAAALLIGLQWPSPRQPG